MREKFPPKPIWHRNRCDLLVEARASSRQDFLNYAVECCRSVVTRLDEHRLPLEVLAVLRRTRAASGYLERKVWTCTVLRARAMIYGSRRKAGTSKVQSGTTMQRFLLPTGYCDLMEQLSDYRASLRLKLDDVALALVLPAIGATIGGPGDGPAPEIDNVALTAKALPHLFDFVRFVGRS